MYSIDSCLRIHCTSLFPTNTWYQVAQLKKLRDKHAVPSVNMVWRELLLQVMASIEEFLH